MVILPKEGVAATVTGLTNQYTYVRAAPYWTAEVIDTMASGVAITIYERDYDYIYVEWTNAGVVKRGYIPRANTATTGYSWCDHTIFVPGTVSANKTVYYKPGGTYYGTVYANEYPLLILRQSGSDLVQYRTEANDISQFIYIDPIDNHWENKYAHGRTTLRYYIDSETIIDGNITVNTIVSAVESWNSISDVNLTRVFSKSISDIVIKGDPTMTDIYGITEHILSGGKIAQTIAEHNMPLISTTILINTNKSDPSCLMTNKSTSDIKMLITHEMGHALKIRHPIEQSQITNGIYPLFYSVMFQGLPSNNAMIISTLTDYDIRSFKIKWD